MQTNIEKMPDKQSELIYTDIEKLKSDVYGLSGYLIQQGMEYIVRHEQVNGTSTNVSRTIVVEMLGSSALLDLDGDFTHIKNVSLTDPDSLYNQARFYLDDEYIEVKIGLPAPNGPFEPNHLVAMGSVGIAIREAKNNM